MLVCSHCNFPNPVWSIHCQSCDTAIQPSINCPNCGILVLQTANFCGQCGIALRQGSLEQYQGFSAQVNPPLLATPNLSPEADPNQCTPPDPLPLAGQDSLSESPRQLLHLQTKQIFPLPSTATILYLGKPNDRCPPDLDLSRLPDSDVISRVHARMIIDDQGYGVEDLGSANGTSVNNRYLATGEIHRLSKGDRISLGKNNLVSFIFS